MRRNKGLRTTYPAIPAGRVGLDGWFWLHILVLVHHCCLRALAQANIRQHCQHFSDTPTGRGQRVKEPPVKLDCQLRHY